MKNKAVNSGKPHGGSYWKLFNKKGKYMGTFTKEGRFLPRIGKD